MNNSWALYGSVYQYSVLVTYKKRVQLTMEGGVGFKKEGESTEEKVKGDDGWDRRGKAVYRAGASK